MSESENDHSDERPQEKRFVTKKQPTPKWIVAVFIGLPSVVIVVLTVALLARLLGGGGTEEPEPPTTDQQYHKALKQYEDGRRLSAEYKRLYDAGKSAEATKQYPLAMAALRKTQQTITSAIDEIKKQLGVEVLPPAYGQYMKLAHEIQQAMHDLIRMAPF